MLRRRDKAVFKKCGRMIERLWRHLQLRQRCHALRVQGVRVSVRGWLLAIEGGKRTSAIPPAP
jgi:hypothetical protein